MTQDEGMGLAPGNVLGGGNFKTEEQRKSKDGRNFGPTAEKYFHLSEALEKIAKAKGTVLTSVALAYVLHKTPNVYPIIGGRKIEHLKGNIEALSLKLSKEDIQQIDSAAPFDVGFPMNFLWMGKTDGVSTTDLGPADVTLLAANAHIKTTPKQLVRP